MAIGNSPGMDAILVPGGKQTANNTLSLTALISSEQPLTTEYKQFCLSFSPTTIYLFIILAPDHLENNAWGEGSMWMIQAG